MDAVNTPKTLLQRNWRTVVAFFGIGFDFAMHAASFIAAALLFGGLNNLATNVLGHLRFFLFSTTVFTVMFTMFGIYRTLSYSSFRSQIYRASKASSLTMLVLLSLVYLSGGMLFLAPKFLVLRLFLFPVLYIPGWFFVHRLGRVLWRAGYGRSNTIAVGSDPDFHRLLERAEEHPELGFNIVSIVRTSGRNAGDGVDHVDVQAVESLLRENSIDQIIFSSSYQLNGSFNRLYQLCKEKRIEMRIVSPESDLLFTRAGLRDIAGVPVYIPERQRLGSLKRVVKRGADVAGSVIALLVLSPLFLLLALAIKLESPGLVFFRQRRSLGAMDKPFLFYKFRSMRVDADNEKAELFGQNESNGALFKMREDPRFTRIGRFIRRFSLDELPQLLNVLRGDMSLVGPRPLPTSDYEQIDHDDHLGGYFHRRAEVKPGMTGLWQVSGRSELGFREMVLLDLYYIEHQTLLFDFEILAQTVPVVLFGKGAY